MQCYRNYTYNSGWSLNSSSRVIGHTASSGGSYSWNGVYIGYSHLEYLTIGSSTYYSGTVGSCTSIEFDRYCPIRMTEPRTEYKSFSSF